ncbi:MAG: RluA family pseudouridine synthase [Candidatus Bipolaricaulota bacterium]
MNSQERRLTRTVDSHESQTRVDKLVASWLDLLSRNQAQKMIEEGRITVNDNRVKASRRTREGDLIRVDYRIPSQPQRPDPQEIPLKIVFEDAHLVGVDKPTSMVVHPAPGHPDKTLVNALLDKYEELPQTDDPRRPGIVHRLDKDTSGALVIARTARAYESLVGQFKAREVDKTYLALVEGTFEEDRGVIEAPVGRSRKDRTKMAVTLSGKDAETKFSVLYSARGGTWLKVKPITGRTHQIRVHMRYIDHPIVGDQHYGGSSAPRLMLHSRSLSFNHPASKDRISIKAPVPRYFQHRGLKDIT